MQLSLTIFEIPGVYISYNFPLTHIPRVNFIHLSTEIFPVCISMLSLKRISIPMVDLTKTTFIRIPHPPPPTNQNLTRWKLWKMKKQLSSRTNAEMYTSKISERVWHRHGMLHIHVYTVKIRQTRYTYHLFAAWIGGICWPKGFAYIYLYPKYRLPINPRQREREINLCAMSSIIPCLCLKPHLLEKLYWQALGGFLESIYVNRILCRSPLYHISSIH